jgi:hypothetical protein
MRSALWFSVVRLGMLGLENIRKAFSIFAHHRYESEAHTSIMSPTEYTEVFLGVALRERRSAGPIVDENEVKR